MVGLGLKKAYIGVFQCFINCSTFFSGETKLIDFNLIRLTKFFIGTFLNWLILPVIYIIIHIYQVFVIVFNTILG